MQGYGEKFLCWSEKIRVEVFALWETGWKEFGKQSPWSLILNHKQIVWDWERGNGAVGHWEGAGGEGGQQWEQRCLNKSLRSKTGRDWGFLISFSV